MRAVFSLVLIALACGAGFGFLGPFLASWVAALCLVALAGADASLDVLMPLGYLFTIFGPLCAGLAAGWLTIRRLRPLHASARISVAELRATAVLVGVLSLTISVCMFAVFYSLPQWFY